MSDKLLQRLRLLAPALVFAVLLATPSFVEAQVRRWSGPPRCNDGDALFARVHAPDLDVEATVSSLEDRLQLRLELRQGDEQWHRVVVGDSCEALVEVAVVVVTMVAELQLPQLDARPELCEDNCPDALSAGTGSESRRTVEVAVEAAVEAAVQVETRSEAQSAPGESVADLPLDAPERVSPVSREVTDAETSNPLGALDALDSQDDGTASGERTPFEWPERWSLSAHIGARFDGRTLPSPRAAVDLGLHLRRRWVRLDVGVLATRVAQVSLDDASAELGLAAGRIGACGGAPAGRFWLGGCAAIELGVVRALGRGVDEPRDEGSFWAGLDLSLRGELGLIGRLSLYVEAGALVPLRRPRFLLQGTAIHTTPALSPRAALGLELRLTR